MDQELNRVAQSKLKTAYSPKRRQTIISGRKGKTYADFIEPLSGLNARAFADSNNPIIASFADGFNVDGQVDHINKITSSVNFENLIPNATNYLGIERIDSNTVSPVITTSLPTYDSIFGSDRENKICATFDGTLTSTNFKDFYDNMFKGYNGASIQTGHPSGTGNSLRINGGTQYADVDFIKNGISINTLETWTFEFWFRLDNAATANQTIFSSRQETLGFEIRYVSSTELRFYAGDGLNNTINMVINNSAPTILSNTWYHVVITNTGRIIKIYMNDGGSTQSKIRNFTNAINLNERISNFDKLFIGNSPALSRPLTGNISNVGFYPYIKYNLKADVIGDIAFSVSTSNLTEDTAVEDRYYKNKYRFHTDLASASINTETYTDIYGNNLVFRRTTASSTNPYIENIAGPTGFGNINAIRLRDVLNSTVEYDNMIFSEKFTLECWVQFNNVASQQVIFNGGDADQQGFRFRTNSNNSQFIVDFGNNGTWNLDAASIQSWTGGNISTGVWYHFAFSYDGATYRFFRDGVQQWSRASTAFFYRPNVIIFGGHPTSDWSLNGYLFGMSLTPYCKYTSTFTPPTSLDSFKEDVYYYDINKAKMYKGYYNNWQETNVIFIGEVLTDATAIEHFTTYSLNGECFIDNYTGGGEGLIDTNIFSSYKNTIAHNIGTNKINLDYWFILSTQAGSKLIDERVKPFAHHYDGGVGTYELYPLGVDDHNYFSLRFLSNGMMFPFNTSMISFNVNQEYGFWQFKIERDF